MMPIGWPLQNFGPLTRKPVREVRRGWNRDLCRFSTSILIMFHLVTDPAAIASTG
jgi:hypothetical protein